MKGIELLNEIGTYPDVFARKVECSGNVRMYVYAAIKSIFECRNYLAKTFRRFNMEQNKIIVPGLISMGRIDGCSTSTSQNSDCSNIMQSRADFISDRLQVVTRCDLYQMSLPLRLGRRRRFAAASAI